MSTIAALRFTPKRNPSPAAEGARFGSHPRDRSHLRIEICLSLLLEYSQIASAQSAADYWPLRGWLLMHITGAWSRCWWAQSILDGFPCALRPPAPFHRICFFGSSRRRVDRRLSHGVFHHLRMGLGFALAAMATAWVTTTGVAYYAILKRRIQIHKEWMARAYVVTFSFVTFRLFNDYGPTSRLLRQICLA